MCNPIEYNFLQPKDISEQGLCDRLTQEEGRKDANSAIATGRGFRRMGGGWEKGGNGGERHVCGIVTVLAEMAYTLLGLVNSGKFHPPQRSG